MHNPYICSCVIVLDEKVIWNQFLKKGGENKVIFRTAFKINSLKLSQYIQLNGPHKKLVNL